MYVCATNAPTLMGVRAKKAVTTVQQQAGSEMWGMNLKYLPDSGLPCPQSNIFDIISKVIFPFQFFVGGKKKEESSNFWRFEKGEGSTEWNVKIRNMHEDIMFGKQNVRFNVFEFH